MAVLRSPVSRALTEFFAEHVGIPCGDGHLPVDAAGQPRDVPLLVLDAGPGVHQGPAFGDRFSGARWEYNLRCVGARKDQAEGFHDRALQAFTARSSDGWLHPVTIDGQYEWDRDVLASGFPAGGGRDGIVTIVLRFVIATANVA